MLHRLPCIAFSLLLVVALLCSGTLRVPSVNGFQPSMMSTSRRRTAMAGTTTVEPPTREEQRTSEAQGAFFDDEDVTNDDDDDYPDMEYLIDSQEAREMDDPFHILLMGSTFDKPKISVPYVAGSLEYVLGMPSNDATELASFAKEHGLSCLGCWPRAECLQLGRKLQIRDIVCRVVPYAEGGQRGWQAKQAGDATAAGGNVA